MRTRLSLSAHFVSSCSKMRASEASLKRIGLLMSCTGSLAPLQCLEMAPTMALADTATSISSLLWVARRLCRPMMRPSFRARGDPHEPILALEVWRMCTPWSRVKAPLVKRDLFPTCCWTMYTSSPFFPVHFTFSSRKRRPHDLKSSTSFGVRWMKVVSRMAQEKRNRSAGLTIISKVELFPPLTTSAVIVMGFARSLTSSV